MDIIAFIKDRVFVIYPNFDIDILPCSKLCIWCKLVYHSQIKRTGSKDYKSQTIPLTKCMFIYNKKLFI